MVIKINYTSSDIYVSTNVSPVYVVVNYSAVNNGGGGAIWGGITGTLSDQTDLQDALDDKVPYTGATANVSLGEFELKAGQLTLDTSPTGTAAVGTTRWNDTIGSSETTLKGGSVILKNGVDLVARVVNKVTPNTTLTKAAYQAVRVSGAQGQRLAVAFAQANNDANSADTIGLVCETIATNQEGFIITVGQLENINTTGSLQGETWADGDVLYLSPFTPGAITKVKPTGNGHIVVIGYVEYAHANNGKIYVKVMNGWELTELHDCDIVTPANNEALIYESSTALWKNKTIASALGYTPVTNARLINTTSPLVGGGDLSADRTISIPAATSLVSGHLTATDWNTFNNKVSGTGATGQVAYWNGTNSQTGSNNLFWDAANARLGIGLTNPSYGLDVSSSVRFSNATAMSTGYSFGVQRLQFNNGVAGGNIGVIRASTNGIIILNNAAESDFNRLCFGAASTSFPALQRSGVALCVVDGAGGTLGNLLVGGTTDGGQRLQVYGDAFVRGSGATNATTALTLQNSSGNNTFRVFNAGSVGFGNTGTLSTIAPMVRAGGGPDVAGDSLLFFASGQGAGQDYLFSGLSITSTTGTIISVNLIRGFLPTFGNASYGVLQIGSQINQTGGANGITRGLYVNPTLTAAADWRSIEWSNNSGWGLYGAGTALNYLGGRLGIGSTSVNAAWMLGVSGNLQISGFLSFGATNIGSSNAYIEVGASEVSIFAGTGRKMSFWTDGTVKATLTAAGRLLLGTTTESTFLLDVNGTARVSGISTLGGFRVGTTNASNAPFIFTFDSNAGSPDGSFRNLSFYNYTESAQANGGCFTFAGNTLLQTSGSQIFINTVNTFAPTSGTASLALLRLGWTINQTGGANGVTRGLYINPTLTSAADWRAIEVSAGVSVLAPSTTASATLRIPSGTAPTSPVNGDIWFDGTDLKMRIGGVTKTFTLV